MGLINTRVNEGVHEKLQDQAKQRGLSLYQYLQGILTEIARGNIRQVVEVETRKEVIPGLQKPNIFLP